MTSNKYQRSIVVACPRCGAAPGKPCAPAHHEYTYDVWTYTHDARRLAFAAYTAPPEGTYVFTVSGVESTAIADCVITHVTGLLGGIGSVAVQVPSAAAA